MNENLNELISVIEQQQKGHENEPMWMVGEQLKDMAGNEPETVSILLADLQIADMNLSAAAAKLKQYSDKNRGKATCFCIPPAVAEKILREFYGLPDKPKEASHADIIQLSDFL